MAATGVENSNGILMSLSLIFGIPMKSYKVATTCKPSVPERAESSVACTRLKSTDPKNPQISVYKRVSNDEARRIAEAGRQISRFNIFAEPYEKLDQILCETTEAMDRMKCNSGDRPEFCANLESISEIVGMREVKCYDIFRIVPGAIRRELACFTLEEDDGSGEIFGESGNILIETKTLEGSGYDDMEGFLTKTPAKQKE